MTENTTTKHTLPGEKLIRQKIEITKENSTVAAINLLLLLDINPYHQYDRRIRPIGTRIKRDFMNTMALKIRNV